MMQCRLRYLIVLVGCSALWALPGCDSIIDSGASLVSSTTGVDHRLVQGGADIIKSRPDKALKTFTPEQEYYLGRTVAARLLDSYTPYDQPQLTRYINLIGQSLAQASDRPATFAGYHFLVLDSEELNAFSAPGGLIFVTRGMLKICQSEDDIAAVLAHEVAHVQEQHGIQAIKKRYRDDALLALGGAALSSQMGGGPALFRLFDLSVKDVMATLLEKGYSRAAENDADGVAVTLLTRVGYDTNAIVRVLTMLQSRTQAEQPGFSRTHPSPDDRITRLHASIGETVPVFSATRSERFRSALADI
jgi:predicted Zn-dependent protease